LSQICVIVLQIGQILPKLCKYMSVL
jgi:hypothetical protein